MSAPAAAAFDLLVVGGGINGTGIARDAAGRGLRVLLCEKDDLAQGTSSRSSRLIHGGLRYLEHGEFRLVRESLHEREVLLRMAPHLVRPLRFVLPQADGMRPAWMLRLGLFLYDHLARRGQLPASRTVWLDAVPEGAPLRTGHRRGYVYADCRTDDARLVVHNALDAHERGAQVRTRTEVTDARALDGCWEARLRDTRSGTESLVTARVLVNAAGPWVDAVAARLPQAAQRRHVRLIKGSHLVVRKFWNGDQGYLLQNHDGRVVFVTPYEDGTAMIGTTDVPYTDAPDGVAIGAEETRYLCAAVNAQMNCALGPADVLYAYAGVRALVDDDNANPSAVTRDYVLDLSGGANARQPRPSAPGNAAPPLLTVLGGKITTFRRLSEQAMEMLRPHLPAMGAAWTARTPLPGGDLHGEDVAAAQARFVAAAAFLPEAHARGLFERHGSRAWDVLAGATQAPALGQHFGSGFYEQEARHLIAREWAASTQDMLWRRTKFGLRLSPDERAAFTRWMRHQGAD